MSDYEQLKQNNLSQEGRDKLDDGGYYEVTLYLDWTNPPEGEIDHYLTLDFVLNDDIREEFFPEIDFESEDPTGERENRIATTLDHSLGELLDRGLVLNVYGNDHIENVDDLEEHLDDFRIVGH